MPSKNFRNGQSDGAKGRYSPPHGIVSELTTWSERGMAKNRRENEDYNRGVRAGRGSRKK